MRRRVLSLALLSLAACVAQIRSEQDQVDLQLPELRRAVLGEVLSGTPVLQGSVSHVSTAKPRCFDIDLTGPAAWRFGQIAFDTPGEVRVELTATPCDALQGHIDDGLTLPVVSRAEVQPMYVRHYEERAMRFVGAQEVEPLGPVEELRPLIDPAADRPVVLWQDAVHTIRIGLRVEDHWALGSEEAGRLHVVGDAEDIRRSHPHIRDFFAPAGGRGELRFVGPDFDERIAPWEAVGEDRVAELRVVGSMGSVETLPIAGLVAVVLDDAGRRVDGVPVRWDGVGRFDAPLGEVSREPVLMLPGLCVPERARGAVHPFAFQASFGTWSDRIEGEVYLPPLDLDEQARQDWLELQQEFCPDLGCACSSGGAPRGHGLALLLLGLVIGGRRRT